MLLLVETSLVLALGEIMSASALELANDDREGFVTEFFKMGKDSGLEEDLERFGFKIF